MFKDQIKFVQWVNSLRNTLPLQPKMDAFERGGWRCAVVGERRNLIQKELFFQHASSLMDEMDRRARYPAPWIEGSRNILAIVPADYNTSIPAGL